MARTAAHAASPSRISLGPWLWGSTLDLLLFGGTALLALSLVLLGHATGLSDGALPEWGWLVFVLAVDVAHVYSTLFRTYLDSEEVASHKLRYLGVPLLLYLGGVALYQLGSLSFWRVLAYLALFHFIRQQVGWVAVYRARSDERGFSDRVIDEAAVYAATLYPVLVWHTRLGDSRFAWFVHGDFVDLGAIAGSLLPAASVAYVACLGAFLLRQCWLFAKSGTLQLGKLCVVSTTALIWYVGIVATNSDFDFTVTNVIVHGVPYVAFLYFFAKERRSDNRHSLGSQIAAGGVAAFLGVLLLLAFVEELAWDQLVNHERGWLFGDSSLSLGKLGLSLVVPLLALPQLTHYVLDGILWRRAETRRLRAQRAALGF